MTRSSFAPNLADSGGASEDTLSRLRSPTTDSRRSAQRASKDGRSKMADRVKAESSRIPPTDRRLPTSALLLLRPASRLPPSTSRARRAQAFSLVELLAVVGIITIVSVAAVPVMRGLGGSQSSRATAQILVSALEQTRTAAILSGTNAYLALPGSNTTTMTASNQERSYAIIRPKVDLDGDTRDDFQTNVTGNWVLLSKWERLPGDLAFFGPRLTLLPQTNPTGLPFPGNAASSSLRILGFTPSGALTDPEGTNGLLFFSLSRSNVYDGIKTSQYSGRIRYVGIVTNATNF